MNNLMTPYFDEKRNMWSFQTISHDNFNQLAKIFVLDSQKNPCKKHIKPHFVEKFLTSRALAYWIMDDGGTSNYNKNYERKGLCTHGFSKRQVEILCKGLQIRDDLNCWLKLNKNKWIIVISGYDYKKIRNLIQQFLIPSMYYKIPGLSN